MQKGIELLAPRCDTQYAAALLAIAMAWGKEEPCHQALKKYPAYVSPAPVVSTACAGVAGQCVRAPSDARNMLPSAPKVIRRHACGKRRCNACTQASIDSQPLRRLCLQCIEQEQIDQFHGICLNLCVQRGGVPRNAHPPPWPNA